MKSREDAPQDREGRLSAFLAAAESAKARTLSPSWSRAFRVPGLWLWHTWVKSSSGVLGRVVLFLALLCQIVLALATCYLIDLSVSLMELWAELARKHMELTL